MISAPSARPIQRVKGNKRISRIRNRLGFIGCATCGVAALGRAALGVNFIEAFVSEDDSIAPRLLSDTNTKLLNNDKVFNLRQGKRPLAHRGTSGSTSG